MPTKEYLKQLLLKHIRGTITDPEKEELLLSIDSGNQAGDWKALILELSTEVALDTPYDEESWEPVIQSILDHPLAVTEPLVATEGRRRVYRMTKWWWAAAAIVILGIGTAVVLVNNYRNREVMAATTNKHLPNDVLPGGNKAILTLSNGQKIALDSAANGTVAQQGKSTIIKLSNGQLTYQQSGSSPEHGPDSTGGEAVQRTPLEEVGYNTMSTPRGGQYKLTLPDGTDVWLNAASSITYPASFAGAERNVSITGEAYFEVAKDKTRPFHVKVNNMEVEVLGTHFNINSYADEASINTTLLEGSVKVSLPALASSPSSLERAGVRLTPGQQAQVSEQIKVINNANVAAVMAWKNGLFNFEGADLKTVMKQLARWYDIDVKYEGDVSKQLFHGEITRDLNLSQVLKILEDVEVKFRIEGKTLIVTQ